jgi:hypothetical protein
VWVIVPLALVLVSPPPRGKEWVLLVLGAAGALLSMRMWPYRGLDMTNMIGGVIAVLCIMRYYLPLETAKAPLPARESAGEPAADGEPGQAARG